MFGPGALGKEEAGDDDEQADHSADAKGQTPSQVGWHNLLVQEEKRGRGTDSGTYAPAKKKENKKNKVNTKGVDGDGRGGAAYPSSRTH